MFITGGKVSLNHENKNTLRISKVIMKREKINVV